MESLYFLVIFLYWKKRCSFVCSPFKTKIVENSLPNQDENPSWITFKGTGNPLCKMLRK